MAFIDRVVEHPGRYTLTNSDTGEVLGTFDLTRAEGTITTEGTQLNAANLNSELQSVITEVNENVSDAVSYRHFLLYDRLEPERKGKEPSERVRPC
jgi:hypothetical protein